MPEVAIAPMVTKELVDALIEASDEYSPMRRVAPHVVERQIGRAIAVLTLDEKEINDVHIIFEVEKELVQRYVGEDYCGLCGRYTDHRGEH